MTQIVDRHGELVSPAGVAVDEQQRAALRARCLRLEPQPAIINVSQPSPSASRKLRPGACASPLAAHVIGYGTSAPAGAGAVAWMSRREPSHQKRAWPWARSCASASS